MVDGFLDAPKLCPVCKQPGELFVIAAIGQQFHVDGLVYERECVNANPATGVFQYWRHGQPHLRWIPGRWEVIPHDDVTISENPLTG